MRRKKNKQMEGQMSIFDMFSSVIENTKTEEENVTVSEGGIAAADITAVETGTQTSIFDLFSTDEQDTQKQEKKPKKNFFHRTIQFAKSLEDKWKNNLAALKMLLGLDDYADEDQQTILSSYEGWGGLSSYFEVEEKKVQLETLVGENTYKGIKSSILTSYYTNEKIINFMYQILSEIGVKGKLNILDPCMGTGNFYRMLPDTLQDSNLYGVELEETSCNIAKQLFQKANIQNCAFEKADLPDNYFDLIIGNVPFSDFSAADNTYGSCLIHDYFFLKALDLARPGGIVAMITTKGTMDKKSSRIRKMLAKKADLLCAIRLPETAFAVTGAKVSTDILFFQKRRYQTVGDEPEWVNIAQEANMYFGTHLNHMLGRMMEESGPYGKRFVCKEKEGMDWKACIDNFHLESYLKDVYEPGQTIENNDEEYVPAVDSISNMSYGIYNDHIYYRKNSMMKKIPDTGMVAKRIAAMIELRNVLKELISKEMQDVSDESIEPYRKKLNMTYDKFQKKFGLIHSRGNNEAHYYKNLLLTTKMNNIAGINTSSNSKRAFDMFMKCQYMEENCRNKGIVFLTGTPVSNSMAEVYTMQRYLQLNTLKELGIDSFDSWASTFGETKTAMELAPEGTGYRARTRFTRFVGLAELLTIFKEVADIKVKDIKEMDVPNAVMETISIDASDEQKKYVDGLASRAARIRDGGVDPSEDNMLKVTNEGRKLALDQRLVGIEEENFNSKAKYCVNQVMDIYEKYPGKTQVIFLDLSTPKKGEFNVYDDVKAKLIERGIPEGEIAFIHSAKTNKQKVDLCKKVNEGVIRVLLGSTDKAGTGCNFQKKLIALHDLDCPWRPSDLTQRSGRIIRQGNFNKEVYIYRYVTKNTFDSYLWQTVENKQRYIGQILSEENIPRRMEEDDLTLSFAEIKAAACGNPLIKEQMELTQQVKRLKMQKNNFLNQYYELESYISKIAPNRIEQYKKNIENIEKDIEVAKKYHTGDFHIKVLDKYDSDTRAEANKIIHNIQPSYKNERKIASYQGFDIILDRKSVYSHQTMIIRGNYDYEFEFSGSTNIMYQIDKIIEYGILEELKTFKRRLEFESRKFVTAKTELNPDFPHESELIKKQARLSELNQKLSA